MPNKIVSHEDWLQSLTSLGATGRVDLHLSGEGARRRVDVQRSHYE